MFDRSPTAPFPPTEGDEPAGPDPVHALAFRGAVTGADAYRAVRSAVRVEGEALRLGNRFVRPQRYREIAFVAVGHAAVSLAFGIHDALGERLTQGFVAGPDPLPPDVPFRSAEVPRGLPGSSAGTAALAQVLELVAGLTERDLLIVAVSPGALTTLAGPPAGWNGPAWSDFLTGLGTAGATGTEVAQVARVFGGGGTGGRLAAHSTAGEVVTLVAERGEGGVSVGGGPTIPVTALEVEAARTVLARLPGVRAPAPLAAAGLTGRAGVDRPVVVAGPADALRGAADAVSDRKFLPRLVAVTIPDSPEGAAEAFLEGIEQKLAAEPGLATPPDGKGTVFFATSTFQVLEGVDVGPAGRRFTEAASRRLRRRSMTVSALDTAGRPRGAAVSPGRATGAAAPGASATGRELWMRPGITDVGTVLVGFLPPTGTK